MAGTPKYKWTDDDNIRFIRMRSQNNRLFTGKKHAASNAWKEIIRQMGLQEQVSYEQASKKWDNLKRKYKELRSCTSGTGMERAETAAAWPCFTAMHEALGGGESVRPPVLEDSYAAENAAENPAGVGREASDAGRSSPLGSVTAILGRPYAEEEGEDNKHFSHRFWTYFQTFRLIRLRCENDHLFTGKRHTAKKAWKEILQQMGLLGQITPAKAAKKWDNMKRKYKELRSSASGTGTETEQAELAASWPWYNAMHEAIGGGESIDPPVLMDSCAMENLARVAEEAKCAVENMARVPDEASEAGGSSPHGSLTTTGSVVCVEVGEEVMVGEDEEEEEVDPKVEMMDSDDDDQLGSSDTEEDDEPCTFACPPPPKRRKTCQADILEFLKEEAAKEEERFRAAQETTNRFLDLFERLINKL